MSPNPQEKLNALLTLQLKAPKYGNIEKLREATRDEFLKAFLNTLESNYPDLRNPSTYKSFIVERVDGQIKAFKRAHNL